MITGVVKALNSSRRGDEENIFHLAASNNLFYEERLIRRSGCKEAFLTVWFVTF